MKISIFNKKISKNIICHNTVVIFLKNISTSNTIYLFLVIIGISFNNWLPNVLNELVTIYHFN